MTNNISTMFNTPEDLLPKLICNNSKRKVRVKKEIEDNFQRCKEFYFSVAFISDSGLSAIRQSLLSLQQRGIKGKLVTSTYLDFNTPKVFEQLLSLNNLDVRINPCKGFHPKGYIFKNDEDYKVLIGSSNLTQYALSVNQEWNISLNSFLNEPITQQVLSEFNEQWDASFPLNQEWIDNYKKSYVNPNLPNLENTYDTTIFSPNKMQVEVLESLKTLRENSQDRGLVISATGTGKTFLAAFDVKNVNPNRILFVVHRENIAKAALSTFRKIIHCDDFGIFTGVQKEKEKRHLFSTIQTMGKQNYLELFDPYDFDYIIIDEVHHAGAQSYSNLLNYFKPKFLLGMTATPERTDGFDIYNLFNHNIAYEIRLQQAMEYDLLCPFHYYGISDLIVNGISIDDKSDFNLLVSAQRTQHIINALNRYQYSGDKVRGLVFVSRIEEALQLSEQFNRLGYHTKALTGTDSDSVRREYMDRLELEDCPESIDYIFTVDIFNEGIDIPSVNQVVMLRPTQSAIVFVQQLGRGLRKHFTKEYVVIIDMIGNYDKNFLIPIALSGDMTYNKDSLRHFMTESSLLLPGASTISFDEISKKKIFQSIDNSKLNSIKIIIESYTQLKLMLGRIPTLFDFDKYNAIDPLLIFNHKNLGSYHKFLTLYEKNYSLFLTTTEEKYLEFISVKFLSGKRIQELELLSILLHEKDNLFHHLSKNLKNEYHIQLLDKCKSTIINEFTQVFQTGIAKDTYKDVILIVSDGDDYKISLSFAIMLENDKFKTLLEEAINFGKHRYDKYFSDRYNDSDLVLYQKYTYEDICRLLNWNNNIVAQNISGYKYDAESKSFPIFINYNKQDVHDSINYEDAFIDPDHITAITRGNRYLHSKDVSDIYSTKDNGVSIHLFVRKDKNDKTSKEFFYLGTMQPLSDPKEIKMKKTNQTAVQINYKLDTTVRNDIYNYITEDNT